MSETLTEGELLSRLFDLNDAGLDIVWVPRSAWRRLRRILGAKAWLRPALVCGKPRKLIWLFGPRSRFGVTHAGARD